jgi:hypothetical protein
MVHVFAKKNDQDLSVWSDASDFVEVMVVVGMIVCRSRR